jgi:DNA-binding transcriptional LysR family regulator
MEIALLEDFIALAECGHFSQAAARRNITQPAFSRRIKSLEDWIGASLFNRDVTPVELTSAGIQFHPMAEEILRLLKIGKEQARDAAISKAQTLRFASTHALSVTFFPNWLQEIEEKSSLSPIVSLVADNMAGCERLMQQGSAHFFLCHHHPSATTALEPRQFQWLDVGTDVLIPVSAPLQTDSLLPRHALPGSMESPAATLSYTATSGLGRIVSSVRALDAFPAWLSSVFSSHVAIVLLAMARDSRGLAWLPKSILDDDLNRGVLVPAGGPEWNIEITVRLFRPRQRQNAAAEAFWAHLRQLYAKDTCAEN